MWRQLNNQTISHSFFVLDSMMVAFARACLLVSDGIEEINGNRKLCFRCNGASIGQNMHMSRAYPNYPIVNVTRVIENGWWAEKKYYNYTTLGCTAGKLCGHYTQVRESNLTSICSGYTHLIITHYTQLYVYISSVKFRSRIYSHCSNN